MRTISPTCSGTERSSSDVSRRDRDWRRPAADAAGPSRFQCAGAVILAHRRSGRTTMINDGRRWSAAIGLACLLSAPVAARFASDAARFTAFAVSMTNGATGKTSKLELVIDRWSTSADRDDLAAALLEQGPNGLLKVMQARPRLGFIHVAGRLGNDIAFARQ